MESGSAHYILESFTERKRRTRGRDGPRERGRSALDDVPDLVVVVIGAFPHLGSSPRVNIPIGQIQTFTLVSPRDPLVASNRKLLVGVPCEASVDLHLDAVGGGAVGDIETLISENLNSSTSNSPRLRSRSITLLDRNGRVIGVTRHGQTFARRATGLDLVPFGGGRAGVGDGPFLVRAAGAAPNLGRIPISDQSTRIIQTLVRCSEFNTPTSLRLSPLLVGIPAKASKDLHLRAVRLVAIRVVEAFVAEDLEGSRGSDGPELGGGGSGRTARTILDDDGCSVSVGGCSETFGSVAVGVNVLAG